MEDQITPPFKEQNIRPPGVEEKMDPKPEYIKENYLGSEKLKDKKAFITGGDSGIGRAVSAHFAREGADVAFTYLKEEKSDAQKTVEIIEREGRKALAIETDLTKDEACSQAVEKAVDFLGGIDILVNNAAFQNHVDSIEELNFEQFLKTFNTNIFPIFKTVKAALDHMPEESCIINTTSILAYAGDDTLMDYAATKGAIRSFTKSLAKGLGERKIRVNAVAPGPVWTPLNPAERKREEVKNFGKGTIFHRPAQPSEIAPAFVYLASEITGSYVTGETINLFGDVSGAN